MNRRSARMACTLLASLALAWSAVAAEDPLRGGDLSDHMAGPKIEAGALTGKVVYVEYWGYN